MKTTAEQKIKEQLEKNMADGCDWFRGIRKFATSHEKNCSKCYRFFIQKVAKISTDAGMKFNY